MSHLTRSEHAAVLAWSSAAGLAAGATGTMPGAAFACAGAFGVTWCVIAHVAGRGARQAARAAERAAYVAYVEKCRRTEEALRATRLTNVPGRPDDAGVIAGPDADAFRDLMHAAGAGDLERKTR
jgi:hypothetical protein